MANMAYVLHLCVDEGNVDRRVEPSGGGGGGGGGFRLFLQAV